MKIVLLGVVGLLIGVGAGAYISGSQAKERLLAEALQAQQDSIAAAHDDEGGETDTHTADPSHGAPDGDTTAHGETDADRIARYATPPGGGAVTMASNPDDPEAAGGEAGAPDSVQERSTEELIAEAVAAAREEQRVADSTAAAAQARVEAMRIADEGAQKLSKIFGAMEPPDAAAVLQEMANEEIEMILKHMSDRRVAQILGEFEPTRAAALSRGVLGAARTGS